MEMRRSQLQSPPIRQIQSSESLKYPFRCLILLAEMAGARQDTLIFNSNFESNVSFLIFLIANINQFAGALPRKSSTGPCQKQDKSHMGVVPREKMGLKEGICPNKRVTRRIYFPFSVFRSFFLTYILCFLSRKYDICWYWDLFWNKGHTRRFLNLFSLLRSLSPSLSHCFLSFALFLPLFLIFHIS